MKNIKYKGYIGYFYEKKYEEVLKKIIDKNYKVEKILKDTVRNYVAIVSFDNKKYILKSPKAENIIPQRKLLTFFKKGEALNTLININKARNKGIVEFVEVYGAIVKRKNNKSKKVDIQQDKKNEGTTDLQTVFAEMSKQYTELRFCDSRMEVFDGKRRFDVVFKDEGEETIISNEYSPYGGLAHKCSLYIDKLDTQGDDLLWQITSERPIYFWILEEQKTKLPFIARIFVNDTPLGELNVYTQQITVKD